MSRGLARAARDRGLRVAALKPYETGCAPRALDARALAAAAGDPTLADAKGLYRATPPLSPWAATLAGETAPPDIEALAATLRARMAGADFALVEGAGGLLVPVDETHDVADLAVALAMPILLVAQNGLGVLSHTLTALEAAEARSLAVRAVVLTPTDKPDESARRNRQILAARSTAPVLEVAAARDDDEALAHVVESAGLVELVLG